MDSAEIILLILFLAPILYILVILCFILWGNLWDYDPRWPIKTKPKYKAKFHHFSTVAIQSGKENYQKVVREYKDHPNQEAVLRYASDVKEYSKILDMFWETKSACFLSQKNIASNALIYWWRWANEYQKRTESLAKKHGFEHEIVSMAD